MNYYPNNMYSNYGYNQYPQSQYQYQNYNNNASYNNQVAAPPATIPGKVVEGEEVVKVIEVPFGGYSVFPKADLSEIYIKSWNNNGTTQVTSYKPVTNDKKEEVDTNALLLEKMKEIESKIDNIINRKIEQAQVQQKRDVGIPDNRKELSFNAY